MTIGNSIITIALLLAHCCGTPLYYVFWHTEACWSDMLPGWTYLHAAWLSLIGRIDFITLSHSSVQKETAATAISHVMNASCSSEMQKDKCPKTELNRRPRHY
jgi:hypothetical protein